MTCTICGKATGPGALLCRPCKAALKRARQLTVQDFPGTPATVTMPAGLIQPARGGLARGPRTRTRNEDLRRRIAWGALALALLVAAGYVGQRGMAGGGATSTAAASTTVVKPAVPPPVAVVPAATSDPIGAFHAAEPAPVHHAPPPQRGPAARSPVASAERPSSPSMAVAPATPVPPPQPEGRGAVVEAIAPVPAPRAEPPAPDRWQTMADSLARCANEGGFSGFICDQRVRLQSCEGYWGQVAQCPNLPENPN